MSESGPVIRAWPRERGPRRRATPTLGGRLQIVAPLTLMLLACSAPGRLAVDPGERTTEQLQLRSSAGKGGTVDLRLTLRDEEVLVEVTGRFFSEDSPRWRARELRVASGTSALVRIEAAWRAQPGAERGTVAESLEGTESARTLADAIERHDEVALQICERDAPVRTPRHLRPPGCDDYPLSDGQRRRVMALLASGGAQ